MTEILLNVCILAYAPLFGTILIQTILNRFVYQETSRRSPIETFLRYPGYSLERNLEQLREQIDGYVLGLVLVPLLTIAFSFALLFVGQLPKIALQVFAALTLGGVSFCSWKVVTIGHYIRRSRKGMEGERAVGWALDRLMADGFIVYHDVPGKTFNLDHVVIGRSGVFSIETKYRSKKKRKYDEVIEWDGKLLIGLIIKRFCSPAANLNGWVSFWLPDVVNGFP